MTGRESRGRWDRTVEWFGARNLALGAVGAAGGPVLSAVLPLANGWARTGVVAAGVVIALLGFAVPAAKSKIADRRAEEAEEEAQAAGTTMRVAMSDSLLPVLSYIVTGVDPRSDDGCEGVAAEAVAMVLASAARLCDKGGKSRTRACWYQLRATGSELTLRPKRHFGRGVCPSTSFSMSEPRGEALLHLLVHDKTELWSDLSGSRPPNWKATGNEASSSYKSFLVVPVRTGARPFGLLMVDSDEPGGLTEEDVPVVQTLGWTLALALSQREVEALPPSPAASRSA